MTLTHWNSIWINAFLRLDNSMVILKESILYIYIREMEEIGDSQLIMRDNTSGTRSTCPEK